MRVPGTFGTYGGEEYALVNGAEFWRGQKLRLALDKRRSDPEDAVFNGMVVTLETIYRDPGDTVYLAVTLDDDPAQELQRELARYLFFFPDEVVRLSPVERRFVVGLSR